MTEDAPVTDEPAEERTWWLDRKENVTKIARTLYVVCGVVLLPRPDPKTSSSRPHVQSSMLPNISP